MVSWMLKLFEITKCSTHMQSMAKIVYAYPPPLPPHLKGKACSSTSGGKIFFHPPPMINAVCSLIDLKVSEQPLTFNIIDLF